MRRSSTKWWERPRRWFSNGAPYRCRACGWRGWRVDARYTRPAAALDDRKPRVARVDRTTALGALVIVLIVAIMFGVVAVVSNFQLTGAGTNTTVVTTPQ